MIQGMTFYSLDEAVKAGKTRTKGSDNKLYIYPKPSPNGLFVDWVLSGLAYSDLKPTVTIKSGKALYTQLED